MESSHPPPVTIAPPRGFTLVEMLVVISILFVLTSLMVFSQSTFNKTLLLNDTAYGIALSTRQAQTFGLSSRSFDTGGGEFVTNAGYGLHFTISDPTNYILFADTSNSLKNTSLNICDTGMMDRPDWKPGDCRFTTSDGTQSTFALSRGFHLSNICMVVPGEGTYCRYNSPAGRALNTLDVVFMRPNTTTVITGSISGSGYERNPATCAEVTLSDQTNKVTKTIRITQLGEISVGKTCGS